MKCTLSCKWNKHSILSVWLFWTLRTISNSARFSLIMIKNISELLYRYVCSINFHFLVHIFSGKKTGLETRTNICEELHGSFFFNSKSKDPQCSAEFFLGRIFTTFFSYFDLHWFSLPKLRLGFNFMSLKNKSKVITADSEILSDFFLHYKENRSCLGPTDLGPFVYTAKAS